MEHLKTATWMIWAAIRLAGIAVWFGLIFLAFSFEPPWIHDLDDKWPGWLTLVLALFFGWLAGGIHPLLGILAVIGVVVSVAGATFLITSMAIGDKI